MKRSFLGSWQAHGMGYAAFVLVSISSGVAALNAHAEFEPILDRQAMDLSADPCMDFEKYACGKWIEKTVIPSDQPAWFRGFSTIQEETLKTNRKLLEDLAAGAASEPNQPATQRPSAQSAQQTTQSSRQSDADLKKLGKFYAGCMNESDISAKTSAFLNVLFNKVDLIDSKNFASRIGELHAMGFRTFFNFGSEQDFQDSSKMIAALDQGGMGLPGRDYYFDEKDAQKRAQYLVHIAKVLELLNLPETEAIQSAQAIFDFETSLAQKALSREQRRDPKKLYHIQTVQELEKLAPDFQWSAFFKATGSPEFQSLNVAVPEFFANLSQVLRGTPLPFVKIYLRWKLISALAYDLGGKYGAERHRFYGKTLLHQEEMTPRWKYCVGEADSSLPDALGRAYVEKYFGEESKKKALAILKNIQTQFEKNIVSVDWMDEQTKSYAIKKLNGFVKKIGYPDQWRDISKLRIGTDHLLNAMSAARFIQGIEFAKIGQKADRAKWEMTPSTVNAYYNPPNNEIVFPAGILQSPMFLLGAPDSANYGSFGAVIGHEMTHGFDDEGRKFDLDGNLRDWWSPNVSRLFEQKAQCLINQYGGYTVGDGVHLKGKLTLGENIADLGGLRISYGAFNQTLPKDLPEGERKKQNQDFFIAYGQSWCSKTTAEYDTFMAKTNPHSPARYRILGVLTNTPEFAKTFGCQVGTPLNPANRCEIW